MTKPANDSNAMTAKLHVEWKVLDDDRSALVFDKAALTLLQQKAEACGVDTADMVAEAVAKLLGTITARKVTERD